MVEMFAKFKAFENLGKHFFSQGWYEYPPQFTRKNYYMELKNNINVAIQKDDMPALNVYYGRARSMFRDNLLLEGEFNKLFRMVAKARHIYALKHNVKSEITF